MYHAVLHHSACDDVGGQDADCGDDNGGGSGELMLTTMMMVRIAIIQVMIKFDYFITMFMTVVTLMVAGVIMIMNVGTAIATATPAPTPPTAAAATTTTTTTIIIIIISISIAIIYTTPQHLQGAKADKSREGVRLALQGHAQVVWNAFRTFSVLVIADCSGTVVEGPTVGKQSVSIRSLSSA